MTEAARALAWDDFRLILAVAETRGLPAAAARLGVNHSTVFRRLKQIEEAIGTPLFERHRGGYALTQAGEEVAALAARVDQDITDVTRRLAGREPEPSGELRVTTSDSLLADLLMPMLARFRRRCPLVRLDLAVGNTELNLSRRDADVAIRATEAPPETLVGRRVARIAWALYGPAGAFPAGADGRDLAAEADWVALGDTMAALAPMRDLRRSVAAERIACKVNSVLGATQAMEAGLGIGHLPCFVGDSRATLRRLSPPEPAHAADLWLLTHPDLRHAPRVRVLLDFLAEEVAAQRPLIEGLRPRGEGA
ncbi:LysR family transcriptional regulator [Roseomonas sp. OT10]|uniref:LysR family transcriptional regulator n=1 Tax=Roseomonas cutis TaxID=2897332 RepID=UPI001E493539|nr:LysR family transcriptional regulator [Roseomonas sp. OT10]UFN48601.1 LysR family transcriptional regulator [Roseomonas sp. OT10]